MSLANSIPNGIEMFDWLINLFRSKHKPCDHKKNYESSSWLLKDGTPMTRFKCHDCGWFDMGHVHGDSEGWPCQRVVVKNGQEISRDDFTNSEQLC